MRGRGQPGSAAEGPRRTLQVDARSQGSGRSPSVSPDRGSTPTSPYSVPQIAPLPSSTLCPICKTTELTSSPGQPNFNACTQCHSKVCNQCGFNPNPHLTQFVCHRLAVSRLRGQTGQTLELETSTEGRDPSARQERCAHQSHGEEVLVPSYLQPPSALSDEHSIPIRQKQKHKHSASSVQQSLDYSESSNILIRVLQPAPASVTAQAAGVGGSALPVLIATSQQLFEALSPKSKRACHCL